MGFLDVFDSLLKQPADQFTLGYIGEKWLIEPENGTYLTVEVESLYIPDIRKITGKFYGAMFGSITVPHITGEDRVYSVVDNFAELKQLDSKHLDRIVQGPYFLLDDVPYYNDGIDVRVSLLSVKSADLIAPYVDLLKTLADAAGVSFLSQAFPYAEAIQKGIAALIGENTIEVGRYATFRPVYGGEYVVIRTAETRLPLEKLSYHPDTCSLWCGGKEVTEYPYFVLKFSSSDKRENWRKIPEIKAAYEDMMQQINSTPDNDAINKQAFDRFAHVIDLSPELLEGDAKRLIKLVYKKLQKYVVHEQAKPEDTTVDLQTVLPKNIEESMRSIKAYAPRLQTTKNTARYAKLPLTMSLDNIRLFK